MGKQLMAFFAVSAVVVIGGLTLLQSYLDGRLTAETPRYATYVKETHR